MNCACKVCPLVTKFIYVWMIFLAKSFSHLMTRRMAILYQWDSSSSPQTRQRWTCQCRIRFPALRFRTFFCTNGRQICGSSATFELLASANLYQSRLNIPHMKALVTRIQNLLLLFKYDHRWLKYLPKLLRRGFSRSFAPRSPELERAALGSWYLDGA